jgi:hypothetical protein
MQEHFSIPYAVDCKCGEVWPCRGSKTQGRVWRGAPGLLNPMRQWIAENCPHSSSRFVCIDFDVVARTWESGDPLGHAWVVELKTHGAISQGATSMTLQAIRENRMKGVLTIRQSQDVPSELKHWPSSCSHCGLPPSYQVSDWVEVDAGTGAHRVTPTELVDVLINPSRPLPWAESHV